MICLICERDFTEKEIDQGVPIPSGRRRMTRIAGVVHDFSIIGGAGREMKARRAAKGFATPVKPAEPTTPAQPIEPETPAERYTHVESRADEPELSETETRVPPATPPEPPDITSLADRLAERWNSHSAVKEVEIYKPKGGKDGESI
jgi:hypothetical protein